MKKLTCSLVVFVLSILMSAAASLSKEDAVALVKRVEVLQEKVAAGDADTILKATHPSVYPMVGGKENYESMTRKSLAFISENVTFTETKVSAPAKLYMAGDKEVCFVPVSAMMEARGMKARTTSFSIAIRDKGSKEWKFVDGGSVAKDPTLVKKLLPKLPEDIVLPPSKIEEL